MRGRGLRRGLRHRRLRLRALSPEAGPGANPDLNPEGPIAPRPRRWAFDWADAVVPLAASIGMAARSGVTDPATLLGNGIGFALSVALPFCGVRQILWAINRRRPVPRPRRPFLAALAGAVIWGSFLLRHAR